VISREKSCAKLRAEKLVNTLCEEKLYAGEQSQQKELVARLVRTLACDGRPILEAEGAPSLEAMEDHGFTYGHDVEGLDTHA